MTPVTDMAPPQTAPKPAGSPSGALAGRWLAWAAAAVALCTFFLIVFNINRGFDITDESFYIMWSRHPGDVAAWFSRYGFYTGILLRLAGGNFVLFRFLGLLSLLAAAGFFSFSLTAYLDGLEAPSQPRSSSFPVHVGILSGVLAYNNMWLLTPSYNWLTLISALLIGSALLRAAAKSGAGTAGADGLNLHRQGILIGAAGTVAFLAKPTTGPVLLGVVSWWVFSTPLKKHWRGFFAACAGASFAWLLLHSFVFEKGPAGLYAQFRDGARLGKLLGGGYDGRSMLLNACRDAASFFRSFRRVDVALGVVLLSVAAAFVLRKKSRRPPEPLVLAVSLSVGVLAWMQLFWKKSWTGGDNVGTYIAYPTLVFSAVLFVAALLSHVGTNREPSGNAGSVKGLALPYFLMLFLGVGYAAGSNLGIIRQMSFASVFPVAACLHAARWMDRRMGSRCAASATALMLSLSIFRVNATAYIDPYRMCGTIGEQVRPVGFLGTGTVLRVDEKTAGYVEGLKKIALGGGWMAGAPLIDLTGGSPGALVVLDARFPGLPWLLGGYPGSREFALTGLSMAPSATLKAAWVLVSPDGPRRIDPGILSELGLPFPAGYEAVGAVKSGHRNEEQILYRPAGGGATLKESRRP